MDPISVKAGETALTWAADRGGDALREARQRREDMNVTRKRCSTTSDVFARRSSRCARPSDNFASPIPRTGGRRMFKRSLALIAVVALIAAAVGTARLAAQAPGLRWVK